MVTDAASVEPAAIVTNDTLDLTACDREPIHIPGAIQPYGMLLIADIESREVIGGAGDVAGRLTPNWIGRKLDELVAQDVEPLIRTARATGGTPMATVPGVREGLDATLHVSGETLMVELEPAPLAASSASAVLARLDRAGALFERASDLKSLCERAAVLFREITGFDRVMIYRFLDDGAGVVIAEDRVAGLHSFLNHHFPATDIPKQARALYVRNRVRVIPDIDYAPTPIEPEDLRGIDLSDIGLRSVSPIHLRYMRNMGVAASASISIVKDGLLWGLVACHNIAPRGLPFEARAACATLAAALARQVRSKEEAQTYRERIRLRGAEDQIAARIDADTSFQQLLIDTAGELREMLDADGLAVVQGQDFHTAGVVPDMPDLRELVRWLAPRAGVEPFFSDNLARQFPAAEAYPNRASGALAVTLPDERSTMLVWFRVEEREVVVWAGNPHKDSADALAMLTPRKSFDDWEEEVRCWSRPWTLTQVESAGRVRRKLFEARQARRLRELNRELGATIADKEALLAQKDHLLREVNHRVQNSLQLVQSFLALQARAGDSELAGPLGEAQRRISAVALVHRRLYQADQLETVDLARYLDDLLGDMREAMGQAWASQLSLDLAPMLISADRAVHVGLVLTELVINANKYAYAGEPGPISVTLEQYRNRFRLIVADRGTGKVGLREGFGTRMMKAMVQRLDGEMDQYDNDPGLRVIVSAPASA